VGLVTSYREDRIDLETSVKGWFWAIPITKQLFRKALSLGNDRTHATGKSKEALKQNFFTFSGPKAVRRGVKLKKSGVPGGTNKSILGTIR